jgi:hypothetical protein
MAQLLSLILLDDTFRRIGYGNRAALTDPHTGVLSESRNTLRGDGPPVTVYGVRESLVYDRPTVEFNPTADNTFSGFSAGQWRTITAEQILQIFDALRTNPNVQVQPPAAPPQQQPWQQGQGGGQPQQQGGQQHPWQ